MPQHWGPLSPQCIMCKALWMMPHIHSLRCAYPMAATASSAPVKAFCGKRGHNCRLLSKKGRGAAESILMTERSSSPAGARLRTRTSIDTSRTQATPLRQEKTPRGRGLHLKLHRKKTVAPATPK